jgi:hypothetical protein
MLMVLRNPSEQSSQVEKASQRNLAKKSKNGKNKRERAAPTPDIETLTSFEPRPAAAEKAAHERDEEDGDEGMTAAQTAYAEEQPGADGDEMISPRH